MNLLEMVCEEIGVEVGEIWAGSDGFKYCILDNGNIKRYEGEIIEGYMTLNVLWKDIITGELKPRWVPVEGEVYYAPNPTQSGGDKESRYAAKFWNEDPYDEWAIENNMVYKTKEEAIAVANKMLEVVKNV